MTDQERIQQLESLLSSEKTAHQETQEKLRELAAKPQIDDCLYHRCMPHRAVPQFNMNDNDKSECGACISEAPISIILFCPVCGLQHIDAPDERTPDWTNPPHKSHLCHHCAHVWRPCDRPTNGVAAIETKGGNDSTPRQNARMAKEAG